MNESTTSISSSALKVKPLVPGSTLMWLLTANEIIVFAAILISFSVFKSNHILEVEEGLKLISREKGIINSILLLVGGFFAAEGVRYFDLGKHRISLINFLLSIATGLGFLLFKLLELNEKYSAGFDFVKNDFWIFYWFIMLFHFVHVLVGVGLLTYVAWAVFQKKQINNSEEVVHGNVLFWHMCDVAWIMIFPIFYLH